MAPSSCRQAASRTLLALAAQLVIGACGGWLLCAASGCDAGGAQVQCVTDPDCGDGAACVMGRCLPRGLARTVALEISPRADSTSMHTGLPAVNLGVDPIVADNRATAMGTMVDSAGAYFPMEHLVVVTPSPIPGQNDWRFETDVNNYSFTLVLGTSMIEAHAPATIWVQAILPTTPPAGQPATSSSGQPQMPAEGQPPISISATLSDDMRIAFPPSDQLISVWGKLHDPLDMPAPHFLMRAYSGDSVVSNTTTTDAEGTFKLVIAPGMVAADATGIISIHADAPAGTDGMSSVPRFSSQPLVLGSVAGSANQPTVFRMPAFALPAPLRFTVQSSDAKLVQGVSVLFRAQIAGTPDGATAIYDQQGTSDANGEVEVMLIPGTVNAPLDYEVSLVPPLDSIYASACVPSIPITMAGSGSQPQYSATLVLGYRSKLVGVVSSSDRSPAASVMVTATPTLADGACGNMPPGAPVSATTDRNGRYVMLLDGGPYRLEVDPPLGAPLPRFGETIDVASDLEHDIALPAGEVFIGAATQADGSPLALAGIKVFDVQCKPASCSGQNQVAPLLRAQAQTDSAGGFRVVVPTSAN